MSNITFHNTELHLQEHSQHEFLLSNKEVALGYGITQQTINDHKNKLHSDELIENKHWLRLEVQTKGGKQKVIHWTKKGIVRLGFFIKSKQAREFRDWAEDYIVNATATPTQLDLITPYEVRRDLTTARRMLTIEKKKHRATAEFYEEKLKNVTSQENQITPLLDEMNFSLNKQLEILLDNVKSNMRGVIDTQIISIHRNITKQRKQITN